MSAEAESAEADTDEEEQSEDEFTYFPQVTQHPTTVLEGDIVDIVTGADIDSDVEDTGSNFGVVFENPEVVGDGTLWKNRNIPDGFATTSEYNDALRLAIEGDDNDYIRGQEVTEEAIEAARDRLGDLDTFEDVEDWSEVSYDDEKVKGTDFKVADPTDRDAEVQEVDGNTLGIDVGGGVYSSEEVEGFDSDRIMVWYGGMSGQFVGRGLDFNGMAFARYTEADDDELPYLVKGLFQVPLGWRGDSDIEQFGGENVPTTDRKKLVKDYGRAPRVVRPPVLRDDIDGRAFIAIGRYNGGNMHEVHIGRAMDDYTEFLEQMRDNEEPDYDGFDMKYEQNAEEILSAAFDNPAEVFALYHEDGWQSKPEETQEWGGSGGSDGGSFDTPDVDIDGDSVEHPTEQEIEFAKGVSEKLAGTGVSPEDPIFPTDDGNTDLEGIVAARSGEFNVEPDVDAIRKVVYENTDHLSTNDL